MSVDHIASRSSAQSRLVSHVAVLRARRLAFPPAPREREGLLVFPKELEREGGRASRAAPFDSDLSLLGPLARSPHDAFVRILTKDAVLVRLLFCTYSSLFLHSPSL